MSIQVDASIDAVLAQMRQMRMEASAGIDKTIAQAASLDGAAPQPSEFSSLLGDSLSRVNDLQLDSGAKTNAYVNGSSDDLVGTMLASQKASVGFQAVIAVRNRMVSAYQDIMNMPL